MRDSEYSDRPSPESSSVSPSVSPNRKELKAKQSFHDKKLGQSQKDDDFGES